MPNWKKVIVSGSNATLNSLSVTTNVVAQSFTGSLFGTSSNVQGGLSTYIPLWDTNTSLTSSYLNQSGNVLKTTYGVDKGLTLDFNYDSYFLGNPGTGNNTYLQVFDGGGVLNIYSPSYTYFNDKVGIRIIPTNPGLAVSGSLEVTGPGTSKFMNSNVQIDGNLFMSGSNRLVYNNDATNNMLFGMFDGSNIYGPYYQLFGNQYANTTQRGSAEFVYDTRNGGVSGFNIASFNGSTWTRKFRVDDNGAQVTGSLIVTNGITGSLYGTASWAENAVNALSAETASNIQGGATNYIPVFNSPTSLSSSVIYQSGSHIGINETNFTSGDPEALYVFQTHPTSFNVVTGKGNSNNYLQLNIQNTNTGTSASSDIVATADNGTETSNYIDMGINGSNFSGPIGDPNDAYLYSAGNHLHIGNITPGQPVQFFVGGDDTDLNRKLQLNDNNQHNMTGSFNVSGSVTAFNFTGSLQGTSSWALNAITASHAVNALSASYALNATNAITALTASYADNFIVAGTLTAQTIVVQTITSSVDFVTGSTRFGSLLSNTHQFTGSVNITGSLAVNGSNVILNNQTSSMTVLSSSYAISASYAVNADLLDGYNRFSFATTGSNIFKGNQTITGSLLVSGSTTQIGNNNLIGNTSLSGSLIISGALSAGTPTIQIFGDVNQTGYTRFLPVVTNIDTSISASYIYVSGSTQDLYFSQNSKGYNNVTRLRWLEGNLYTGLLNGGVISATVGSTTYTVSSGSGIIVDLNASLNDNPYPTIQYVNWGNLTGNISPLTSSYQQAFVAIDSTGNINQQGTPYTAGQFDTVINVGVVLFQNGSTINAVKTQPSTAYGFEQNQNIFNRAFGPLKLSGFTFAPSGSSTGSLVVGSGTAYAPGSNYTIDPNNPSYAVDSGTSTSKIFRYYQSGSSWVYLTNAGAGFGAIDPSQYSNNGVLTTIPSAGSNWSIQRVFWFPNSVAKAIVVYYGNAYYGTEVDAIANINVESFVEAPNTAANAVYLGAIVIKGNGVFTNTTDYKIIPGGLFRQVGGSGGGGSVVTQTLAGLSDVLISGPTNLQPLAYSTTAGKWVNTSALSASIAGNANTATTASFALTASYALNAVSSSYALNATSASYALVATSASYALSSSYALNATTASHALTALSSSYALTATTASHALTALSSSYPFIVDGSSVRSFNTSNVNTSNALFIGVNAGGSATAASNSTFLGSSAGSGSTNAAFSNFLGASAGRVATNAYSSNFLGFFAGDSATNAFTSNFIGEYSGFSAASAANSNFLGYFAGSSATNASNSNFIGQSAGASATFASGSNFIGYFAGLSAASASLSTLIGYSVGRANTGVGVTTIGSNNIIIGTNITLGALRKDSINLGGIIFGTGSYSTITGNPFSGSANGRIGINQPLPLYNLDVNGSGNYTNGLTVTGSLIATSFTGSLFGTASWANNAITSSNALTASTANSGFTIGTTQTYTNIVASTVVGSNNVFTHTTGSYTSAFYKYTVSNGANARSGEVIAVWNGSSAQYTDYSTLDIGSTSGVVPSVSVVGSDVLFNITTGTSGWRLKSTVTYL